MRFHNTNLDGAVFLPDQNCYNELPLVRLISISDRKYGYIKEDFFYVDNHRFCYISGFAMLYPVPQDRKDIWICYEKGIIKAVLTPENQFRPLSTIGALSVEDYPVGQLLGSIPLEYLL